MLYRVLGDPKYGYDLGVGTGTYGAYTYVQWVRTLGPATVRVRYGTHVPSPRTVPVPKSTYLHTPVPTSTSLHTVPPRDAQIENLDFITLEN